MKHFNSIHDIFKAGAGYAHTGDVLAKGIHFTYLKKLEEAGTIVQVSRGLYRWDGMPAGSNDMVELAHLFPHGVFCLFSAAEFHELTTYQPWQHHIAIERSSKVKIPAHIPVKVYYWSKPLMDLGVLDVPMDRSTVRIFNVERTVCDLVKFRQKTGKDVMLEAIRNYLRRKDKNISLLLDYARLLRIENILKPYLEIAQ
jgi:predicted transcriptional regulator of viral defense system